MMLKKLIAKYNITYGDIAKVTGIKSHSTISVKVNGKADFFVKEIWAIRDYIYEKTGKFYYIEDLFREE